jgi:hypothetical protein
VVRAQGMSNRSAGKERVEAGHPGGQCPNSGPSVTPWARLFCGRRSTVASMSGSWWSCCGKSFGWRTSSTRTWPGGSADCGTFASSERRSTAPFGPEGFSATGELGLGHRRPRSGPRSGSQVTTSPSAALVGLIKRAIGHVVKVIMHADDSNGAIGELPASCWSCTPKPVTPRWRTR